MEQKAVPRKMKYAPKGPPRRPPKPEIKPEPVEHDDKTTQALDLLQRINEGRIRPKVEKKLPASQVAWFGGVANSTKSYSFQNHGSSSDGVGAYGAQEEKEYREPWDYYSYYPVTLPMRRPYSGNPELLDEEEFGETSQAATYNENYINPAMNLGLTEEGSGEPRMFFMQLPTVPMPKQPPPSGGTHTGEMACGLKELPAGFMGKLLVYRSGAVKLKLGDMLYDMNQGLKSEFAQDVVAINTAEKDCCLVGEVNKHAVLTPDLDSVLNNLDNV